MINEEISIIGFKHKPIKATLSRKDPGNRLLAVIFPGYGYTVQGPVLFYSKLLLENMGYDVLAVEYRYNEDEEFDSATDHEQDEWFRCDISAVVELLKANKQYNQYVFLGKSMGTAALLHIAQTRLFTPAKYIWLTPDDSFEDMVKYIDRSDLQSLIIGGGRDPYFRPELRSQLKGKAEIKVFNNAGHSLEEQNDVYASMENIKEAIAEIHKFILKGGIHMMIRKVGPRDLDELVRLENICFPEAEAATREAFAYRIAAFPDSFYVAVENNEIIGIVNGCVTDSPVISDDLFEPEGGHNPNGKNQAIFGLLVDPRYQKQGIAASLMNHFMDAARQAGREKMILTCKEHLIHYYEKLGYVNLGVSKSVHGGAVWYDMEAVL